MTTTRRGFFGLVLGALVAPFMPSPRPAMQLRNGSFVYFTGDGSNLGRIRHEHAAVLRSVWEDAVSSKVNLHVPIRDFLRVEAK